MRFQASVIERRGAAAVADGVALLDVNLTSRHAYPSLHIACSALAAGQCVRQ